MPTENMPNFNALIEVSHRIKIVDIGANPVGGNQSYHKLLASGSADVVGFEPNRDALLQLYDKKGKNETYLPFAIGDGGRQVMNFCHSGGMSSLLKPDPHVLQFFRKFNEWGTVVAMADVDTKRLDDIPETEGVDLIKIDIQGAELMVFQNAVERLKHALVIQTEVEFMPLYVNQPLFSDVDQFLRQFGFMFHRFFPAVSRMITPMFAEDNVYAGMSQLVWADAIFIKDFTHLERLDDAALLRMAAIMHDCYESLDLVMRLLIEYDQRRQTNLAEAYMRGIQSPWPEAAKAA